VIPSVEYKSPKYLEWICLYQKKWERARLNGETVFVEKLKDHVVVEKGRVNAMSEDSAVVFHPKIEKIEETITQKLEAGRKQRRRQFHRSLTAQAD
jgi:hypothetical protein